MGIRSAFLACFFVAVTAFAGSPEFDQAQNLYKHTEFIAVIKLLNAKTQPDAAALRLLGQSYFMLGEYKKATEVLDRAAQANPTDSDTCTWLGRAYGRRAETSFAVAAVGFAAKSRANLEKAVQLNPSNSEAINDLFEFYLQAPGFLGGGLDKADRLANQIARQDPVEGNYAKARLAEEHKQYATAEAYLRRAIQMAPDKVGRVLDLAKFLAKQGRFEESEQTFTQAEKVAPDAPKVLFAHAATYIKSKRNVETARQLLKRYLAANLTPEDPTKLEALKLLKQASGV